MKIAIEQAKNQVIAYYKGFIDKCIEVNGIDLHTMISDCVTAGFNHAQDLFTKKAASCAIDATQPFSVFTDAADGQWAWIADYSDPEEYAYLDDLFLYLIGDKGKDRLPEELQSLSDNELTETYQKRFQVMFGKAMQEIGQAVETDRIKITLQFPKRD